MSGVRMSRSSDVVSCTRMRAVALPLRLEAPIGGKHRLDRRGAGARQGPRRLRAGPSSWAAIAFSATSSGRPALKMTVPVDVLGFRRREEDKLDPSGAREANGQDHDHGKRDRQGDVTPAPGQLHQAGENGTSRNQSKPAVECRAGSGSRWRMSILRHGRDLRGCCAGAEPAGPIPASRCQSQRHRHHDCHPCQLMEGLQIRARQRARRCLRRRARDPPQAAPTARSGIRHDDQCHQELAPPGPAGRFAAGQRIGQVSGQDEESIRAGWRPAPRPPPSAAPPIIWPIVSPIIRMGAKAASVVDIAAITGVSIMPTPFSAAVCGSSPICSRVAVCSPTTMASSTMMPSIMISENSEIMLIVWPEAYMKPIVASIATGMPAATQKAMRALRNRNRIATTTSRPPSPFLTSSQIRAESASEATS
jgi:hypothetical protein